MPPDAVASPSLPFTRLADALSWLDSHIDFESSMPTRRALPTLDRMHALMSVLGEEMGGEGEYVAFMSAGAYGHVMASRYNTRPLAAEVLVKGSAFELVNARETFEQIVAGEKVPAFLR